MMTFTIKNEYLNFSLLLDLNARVRAKKRPATANEKSSCMDAHELLKYASLTF